MSDMCRGLIDRLWCMVEFSFICVVARLEGPRSLLRLPLSRDEISCGKHTIRSHLSIITKLTCLLRSRFICGPSANLLGHDFRLGMVKDRAKASLAPSFGDPLIVCCSLFRRASEVCLYSRHYESALKLEARWPTSHMFEFKIAGITPT